MRFPPLVALAAATILLAGCGKAAPPAAASGESPSDFSVHDLDVRWRDQDGGVRTLGGFAGKTVVLAMVYAHCTSTCPAIIAELKRIEAALSEPERASTHFVLVSLDPARDTPPRLHEWAASLRLSPERWTLLTGDPDAVRQLAALIGIRYRAEAGGDFSHSNAYLVLDPGGHVIHHQTGLGTDGVAASLAAIRTVH